MQEQSATETPMTPVCYPVFRDDRGNRFMFPGLYSYGDKRADWSVCRAICVALGVTEEATTFDVVPVDGFLNFPRIISTAASRGFAHGGEKVWLIGGPEYDRATTQEPVNE